MRVTEAMDAKTRNAWRRIGGEERLDEDEKGRLPRKRLQAMEEALRRDMWFLATIRRKLFQSLWNLVWWYDCEELRSISSDLSASDAAWDSQPGWSVALATRFRSRPSPMVARASSTGAAIGRRHKDDVSRQRDCGAGNARQHAQGRDQRRQCRTHLGCRYRAGNPNAPHREIRSFSDMLAAIVEGRDVSEEDNRARLSAWPARPMGRTSLLGTDATYASMMPAAVKSCAVCNANSPR